MASDDPHLVPEPPPARPERRDSAIEAALRRFDGEPASSRGAAARPASRPHSWSRNPQLGLALAASLAIVIGIPAAVIVLRDQGAPPATMSEPPPIEPRAAAPGTADRTVADAPPSVSEQPRPVANPAPPDGAAAPQEAKQAADQAAPPLEQPAAPAPVVAAAPPPPATAAPPPPPPPAPPPPMAAQKGAERSADIAVTGTRVARPSAREERRLMNDLPTRQAPAAPDWVLNDRSYATFLGNLQAAVRSGDRSGVIRLIQLPLRVNFSSGSRVYRDRGSIRADYERIFTPRVRRAVLEQRFDQLYGGSRGLMIGSGEVWFDHVSPGGPVRITAVNP